MRQLRLLSRPAGARGGRRLDRLLKDATLEFIGNVEARDLYSGLADVIVCDGFTGNIALKVSEGLVDVVDDLLHEELSSTITMRVGSLFAAAIH